MTKLYLMRHGETYFNVWHKIQGWCDSPLTPKGIAQANYIHDYFEKSNIKLTKAYCSTAERASDTLELVINLPYHRRKDLKEWYFGNFEGQDERLNPQPPYKDFFVPYGGESQKQVQDRIHKAVFSIMENTEKDDQALIVSHAGAIFNFLLSVDVDALKIRKAGFSNCSVLVFDYKNDNLYLEKIVNPKINQ